MQTPWGPIPVVDSHVHLFSYAFFDALAGQRSEPGGIHALIETLGWERPPRENTLLARRWVKELDAHGVAQAVMMASVPGDEASASDVVAAYPDRFYGYFMFDPLAPDSLERARRAFDDLKLKGLCLFPAMHHFSVQDERLDPIYALAEERDNVVLFVHMGALTVGVRDKLGLPSRFDLSLSNPIALHRIAAEHPRVNFVIPHFGAGFFREILMLGDLVENVYLDTSSSNGWTKYLWPEPTLDEVFGKVLEIYGPGRLLFGTDSSFFPRGWNHRVFDTQVAVLERLGLGEEAAGAILGGNMKRLMDDRSIAAV